MSYPNHEQAVKDGKYEMKSRCFELDRYTVLHGNHVEIFPFNPENTLTKEMAWGSLVEYLKTVHDLPVTIKAE